MPTKKHACPPGLLTAFVAVTLLILLPFQAAATEPVDPAKVKTYDDELAEMADEMPGFGGWYTDEKGRLNAYMTDLSSTASRSLQQEEVLVKQGQFNFRQLLDWKRAVRNDVLAMPGVQSLDIDESRNRIVVGVTKTTRAASIESLTTRMGLPSDAILVEQVKPFEFQATLRTYDKYRKGGLQIQYVAGGNTWNCTLGFIAYHEGTIFPPPGYSDRGMVTNSHCSATQGAVESTGYRHPTTSYSQFAHELIDPGFFTNNGCPAGRRCRFSDAIFATYHPLKGSSNSSIARPQSRSRTSGTLTISSSSPKLTIARESANATLGMSLNKVGRTTGWTYGNVTSTCQDINVANTNITLFCQNVVNAGSAGGDSGSPVFFWFGNSYVVLHGILWGGDGTNFAYSPLGQVEQELGPLSTSKLVPPIARFNYTSNNPPFGSSFTFNAGSSYDPDGGSIVSYRWSFNGSIQTTTSSSVTRTLPAGSNTVQLTVTDNEGATSTTTQYVHVFDDDGCLPFQFICI